MGLLSYPLRFLDTLADRIVVVVGVLVICQFPSYMNHYTQRLGGHVAEAKLNVAGWQEIADGSTGGDVVLLSQRYLASSEVEVIAAGRKCDADVERYRELNTSLVSLKDAGVWSRPFVFISTVDVDVAQAAFRSYTPGLPLYLEGLIYALIGLFGAFFIYRGCRRMTLGVCRRCGKRLKRRRDGSSDAPGIGESKI